MTSPLVCSVNKEFHRFCNTYADQACGIGVLLVVLIQLYSQVILVYPTTSHL